MSGYIFLDKLKKMTDYLEEDYAKTLEIKKEIFRITQPKSPVFSKDKIQSNEIKKWFDVYLELKEKLCIEKRSREVNRMLKLRNKMLKSKEHELRLSRDLEDIIYCLWFLDKKSAREISYTISYQKTVVYSILNNIKTKLFEKIKSKN